jgi:hypothetical protein
MVLLYYVAARHPIHETAEQQRLAWWVPHLAV